MDIFVACVLYVWIKYGDVQFVLTLVVMVVTLIMSIGLKWKQLSKFENPSVNTELRLQRRKNLGLGLTQSQRLANATAEEPGQELLSKPV